MAEPDIDAWLASKAPKSEGPDVDAWLASKGVTAEPEGPPAPPLTDPVAAVLAREVAARRLAKGVRSAARKPAPGLSEAEGNAEAAAFGGANAYTLGMFNRGLGGVDYLTGGSPSYSAGVDKVAAHEDELRRKYPWAHAGGSLAGGIGSGVGLMRSGVGFSRTGATIPQRIGMGTLEGGAFGAAQGAGQTYSGNLPDYVNNAIIGGGFGAAGGAIGEAVGAGAGSIYGSIRDRRNAVFPEPMLRAARADAAGLERLPTLGPDAMLVDAGPSSQAVAQAAALGIGPNRTAIVHALMERDRGTVPRLQADVTEALGAAPRPSQVAEGIDAGRRQINTEYDPVLRGRAIEPGEANRVMGRLNELALTTRENLDEVVGALTVPGHNLPDLSPQAWLAARQRVDSMIEAASNPMNPNRYRASVLTNVRRMIDDELAANVPGIKAVDAKFAANRAEQEALERGSTVLDTGKQAIHPDDLRDIMRVDAAPQGMAPAGPPAANVRLRQGVRADIDRRVGTASNDLVALEKSMGSPEDWNAQKLAQVFGQEPTQAVRNSVARNREFRENYQRIVQGSDTAQRAAAKESSDLAATMPVPTRNVAGTVEQVGRWGLGRMQEAQRQAQRETIARLMATRDPAQVEALRQQLLAHARETMPGIRATDARTRNMIQGGASILGPAYDDYVR